MYDIPCMRNLKRNDTNELAKQKETHRLREGIYGCRKEGIVRELGMDMYTLLYLKQIINKGLLYSTWNSAQCYVAAWMGGGLWWEWIHVHVWLSPTCMAESLRCPPETITTLLIGSTQVHNKLKRKSREKNYISS